MTVNSYNGGSLNIALQRGSTYIPTAGQLSGYSRTMEVDTQADYIAGEDYPLHTATAFGHGVSLTGLIYNDGTAADKLRLLRDEDDTFVNFLVSQSDETRRMLYGRALLAIPSITDDGGVWKLSPEGQGEGNLQFRKLHTYTEPTNDTTAVVLSGETIIVHVRDPGDATAITARIRTNSKNYDVALTLVAGIYELTPKEGANKIPAAQTSGQLSIVATASGANFAVDIGV